MTAGKDSVLTQDKSGFPLQKSVFLCRADGSSFMTSMPLNPQSYNRIVVKYTNERGLRVGLLDMLLEVFQTSWQEVGLKHHGNRIAHEKFPIVRQDRMNDFEELVH